MLAATPGVAMVDVRVHLLSTPWSNPRWPSVQTACLKAWLADALPGVPVHTYAAFHTLLERMGGVDLHGLFDRYAGFGEAAYLLAYAHRFALPGAPPEPLDSLLDPANRSERAPAGRLDAPWIERLAAVSAAYVVERLLPRLEASAVHVIGFTLNYDQVWSSLFLAREIQERAPDRRFVFLFGGASRPGRRSAAGATTSWPGRRREALRSRSPGSPPGASWSATSATAGTSRACSRTRSPASTTSATTA